MEAALFARILPALLLLPGVLLAQVPSGVRQGQPNTMMVFLDAGSTDTYSVAAPAYGVCPSAYDRNLIVGLVPNTSNTGPAALEICSLGSLSIKTAGGSDPSDNDMDAGKFYLLRFVDSAIDFWQMQDIPSGGGGGGGGCTPSGVSGQILTDDGAGGCSSATPTISGSTITGNLSGNATTASSLAGNPTDCPATQFAESIVASGNLGCRTITDADVPNNINIDLATAALALNANPANCSPGNSPLGVDAAGAVEGCFDAATQTELDAHTGNDAAHNAVSTNTVSRIVLRDASGNFAAGTITAALAGNATTATNLAANGSNCTAGNSPLGVDAAGAAEGCFDVATQTELSTHTGATSGVHGATGSVVGTTDSQDLSNKNLIDSSTNFVDDGDVTKRAALQLSGITTGNQRIITIPDANSVTVRPTTATANQFVTHTDSSGIQQKAQPAFSDLSGAATDGQIPNNITVDLASAATALASNGTNCSPGEYARGVDASGNAENCTVVTSGSGGNPNYETTFTSQTSVTVLGTTHGFGHGKILVTCFDNGDPKKMIFPSGITIDSVTTPTYDVTITFGVAQTGSCVLNGTGGGGAFSQSFTTQTSVTVTHNFATENVVVACYNGSNQLIGFDSLTVNSANAVTVTFTAAQTGRCVASSGGSGGGGGGGGGAVDSVSGTANEVTVSPTTGDVVVSLPANVNLGSKTSFTLPTGAAPTTDVVGKIAMDNNAWASGRGAPQIYDGTANAYVVAVQASDTPANGECPIFQTGGTVLWQTCGAGGGASEFSGLTDQKVTVSGSTITIAAGKVRYGNVTTTTVAQTVIEADTNDSATIYLYVDYAAGSPAIAACADYTLIDEVNYTGGSITPSNCTGFPNYSIPLATVTITSGTLGAAVEQRAANQFGMVPAAGTGLVSSVTNGGRSLTLSTDDTLLPKYFSGTGAPATVSGSRIGSFYFRTDTSQVYACFQASSDCTTVAAGNWVALN